MGKYRRTEKRGSIKKRGISPSFYYGWIGICNKSNIQGIATDDLCISYQKSSSFFENQRAIGPSQNQKAKNDNNKNSGRSDFNQNNSNTPQLEKKVNKYIMGKEKHTHAI